MAVDLWRRGKCGPLGHGGRQPCQDDTSLSVQFAHFAKFTGLHTSGADRKEGEAIHLSSLTAYLLEDGVVCRRKQALEDRSGCRYLVVGISKVLTRYSNR